MKIGALIADHFWLLLALCFGGVILLIVFPVVAILALTAAIALFLITYNPNRG